MTFRPPHALVIAVAVSAALAAPWSAFAQTAATPATKPPAGKKAAASRGPADRLLTPEQLKACMEQRDSARAGIDASRREKAELDREKAELQAMGDAIATERTTVDATDPAAVDAFNRKIEARNARVDAWQAKVDAYNPRAEAATAAHADYEKACAERRYDERDLADIQRKKK